MNVRCAFSIASVLPVLLWIISFTVILSGKAQVGTNSEIQTVLTGAFHLRKPMPGSTNSGAATIPPPYSSRYWSTGDDSSRNVVHAVAQTSDGIIWVGTAAGLARFDTEHFQFVALGSSNSFTNKINALCAGKSNELWVGTAGQGLLELRGEEWIKHRTPQRSDPNILSIFRNDDESIFVGTRKGIALLKDGTLASREDDHDSVPGPEKSFTTETVRSFSRGTDGDLWLGAGDNLMRMRGGAIISASNLHEFNPTYIRSVCYRRDGSIWIGVNSGLICFRDGKFTIYAKFNGLPDNIVTVVFEDSRSNLWIGTSAGLCRFVDGRFLVETTSEGDTYDQIHCLFEDRENNLWVGSKNGLYQLRVQQFTTYTARHGLAHNNVTSVYEEEDGTIWVGTWGGGLHCLRPGSVSIFSSAKNQTIRNDLVLAIGGASDGGIWFCGDYDSGIYRVKEGEVKRIGWELGFQYIAARALFEESANRLLIGTAVESLVNFEDGKASKWVAPELLPSKNIRALLRTKKGTLWIGTDAGLAGKTGEALSTFTVTNGLLDNFVYSLYEGSDESLWIGTGRGLNRLQNGKFTSYSKEQGLLEGSVLEILEDDSDNLWLATRQGIHRINRGDLDRMDAGEITTLPVKAFGRTDGLLSPVCVAVAKPSAVRSQDGRLWFATTKGLAVTDPNLKIGRNEVSPPVVIREILADKKVQDFTFGMGDDNQALASMLIPRGSGELEFRYTALSYAAPEKNQFKYKLKGFDAGWVDAGTRRAAFYNSVPPGSYEFQVVACNNDGVWNEIGSAIKLTLQPHYWQTKSFKGLLGLTLFGLVAGMARYVTWKRVRIKMQQLEQQHAIEKERTRIARDMHDELGARLTEIRVLSDLTGRSKDRPAEVEVKSRRISAAAGELIGNLHSIVWAVNPANDSLEKLSDFICGFAQPFLEAAGIRCRFELQEQLPECRLSSEVRHHIVLAIKEALNNAVKHAEASEVKISLSVKNSKLTVSIADNGKGFQSTNTSSFGNGLQNMEKRMRNIDSSYQLLTAAGQGTTIRLEIPLKDATSH